MIDIEQSHLEHSMRKESQKASASLDEMEQEKLNLPEEQQLVEPSTFMGRFKRMILGDSSAKRRSADFVECLDGSVTKRKKSRVKPRYYPGEKAEIKGVKAKHEAEDFAAGQAIQEGLGADYDNQEEFSDEYDVLFAYLDEKRTALPLDMEQRMLIAESNDKLQVLRILSKLTVSDAAKVVLEKGGKGAYTLRKRLSFYQALVQGKATRNESRYNYQKSKYKDVAVPIPADSASRDNIELGLLRDVLYAEMVGSPELAAVKIATNRVNQKIEAEKSRDTDSYSRRSRYPKDKIRSVVQLSGYYSGIFHGNPGQYTDLIKLYEECFEEAQRALANREVSNEELEHRAVLITAERLEGAYEYSGVIETSASPYNPGFKETIAVGRLGERVRRQMSGMRHKIQETDLHNVERFVGKSGNNKHEPERRTLKREIKFLEETYSDQEKQRFTTQQNETAEQRYRTRYERIAEKLAFRLEKSQRQIESLELPDEEKELQLQSLHQRHEQQMADLNQEYYAEIARLHARTPEELLADLQKRQELVNQRYERRKSLAQRALDLHFRFNHVGRLDDENESDVKPFAHMVDWINDAPLGTIKRSHNMLRKGVSEQTVVELALAEIILGNEEINRESLAFMHKWVENAKGNRGEEWWKLVMASKVRSVLRQFRYDLPLNEVLTIVDQLKGVQSRFDYNAENLRRALELFTLVEVRKLLSEGKNLYYVVMIKRIADRNAENLRNALGLFTLVEVRKLLSEGNNLYYVVMIKRITDRAGYELSPEVIAEMSRHRTEGLESALDVFDVDTVRFFLSRDINLPVAVAVYQNTAHYGYELTSQQIVNIAKNVNKYHIDDFVQALANLPLNQVEELFTVGVAYKDYQVVQQALDQHRYPASFGPSLEISSKLSRQQECGYLGKALDVYTLEEVNHIIKAGVDLSNTLSVRKALDNKGVETDLNETILFTRFGGSYSQGSNVEKAIDTFGIEGTRRIVSKACKLDKALKVKKYHENKKRSLNSQDQDKGKMVEGLINEGVLDLIIAVAKAGDIEVATDNIEAGFTAE